MVHHSLKEFRTSAGSLGGIAGANLVALAMVISLVYAMLAMASVLNFGLLPDFIVDYLISFLIKIILRILCIMITGIISGYIGLLLFKTIQFVQQNKFVVQLEKRQM